jgi:hypothetical protein
MYLYEVRVEDFMVKVDWWLALLVYEVKGIFFV